MDENDKGVLVFTPDLDISSLQDRFPGKTEIVRNSGFGVALWIKLDKIDLPDMQAIVDGHIDCVPVHFPAKLGAIDLWCNDEGALIGLQTCAFQSLSWLNQTSQLLRGVTLLTARRGGNTLPLKRKQIENIIKTEFYEVISI